MIMQKKKDDERKQYTTSPTKNYDYTAELTYSEPIARATFLQFRYKFQYKYSESDDDPIQQIRCKSLAAISNFFKVTKNGDNYNMGISNAAELCKFFGDKTVYMFRTLYL